MRILAIDTVEKAGSVALVEEDRLLAERPLEATVGSAQSLAPGIQQLLEQAGWRPRDVQLVAVATGPGSFTGLRIGVTTAKAFAYATGCEVIGVSTMEAIASRAPGQVPRLSIVVDAHRGELFVADFHRADGRLVEQQPTRTVDAETWIAALSPDAVVTGPALSKYAPRIGSRAVLVDAAFWMPAAAAVGRLGWRDFAAGRRTSPFELVPQYFRRTAAEEKADDKRQQAEG